MIDHKQNFPPHECDLTAANGFVRRSSQKNLLSLPESETLKKFPGMNFTADQQCEMKFGEGYRRARRQEQDDVCRILKCERKDGSHLILSNAYTAMQGTTCGPNMVITPLEISNTRYSTGFLRRNGSSQNTVKPFLLVALRICFVFFNKLQISTRCHRQRTRKSIMIHTG